MKSSIESPKEILCMGAINMDLVVYMDHLPKPGETITVDNFQKNPGGKGGNQAVAASILGGRVCFFGKVGCDIFGDELLRAMTFKNVDTSHILRETNNPSGIAMIFVDHAGQNCIAYNPGANSLLTINDIHENATLFKPNGILLITLEVGIENICEAIRLAKKNGMFVILDPAPYKEQIFPNELSVLIDVIKPNENEASQITNIQVKDYESAEKAMSVLLSMGFPNPIITLGSMGLLFHTNHGNIRCESIQVNSTDSTAAGDVFSGAFTASLSRGLDFCKAISFASAAATLSTTRKGAQTSIPSIEEVEQLLLRKNQNGTIVKNQPPVRKKITKINTNQK